LRHPNTADTYMLNQLRIQNFAIIDDLDISLDKGMSVITGETGAGKSIAIDALGLTLGDRAEAGAVKHGAKRSDITAVFNVKENALASKWLEEHELDEDEQCILRRTISASGGSKAYINGSPATLQQIKTLGELLIDIHSQHQHQSLLRSDTHRRLLDSYGQCSELTQTVKKAYNQWHSLELELESLKKSAHERSSRIEFLKFQIDELTQLEILDNEWDTLETEHKQLANAEKIQFGLNQCLEALYSNENNIGSQLEWVTQQLNDITEYISDASSSLELINSALININEAVNELRHLSSDDANDPQRLSEVEARIGKLLDIARKHNCKPAELMETQNKLESELNPLLNSQDSLDQLDIEIQKAKKAYDKIANQLSKKRKTAAKKLETACDDILASLGMKNCQLQVSLETVDNGGSHGNEKITFLVRTNPGSPYKPLIKVASGGELSRISLAIQVVTAKLNSFPVLVFDEVDVGIGGGTAEVVGKLLRQLSEDKQVLCITHQAQVAAQGHYHWIVEKQASNTDTLTNMRQLNKKERQAEIARMIGGITLTTATQKHAKEMLENAGA